MGFFRKNKSLIISFLIFIVSIICFIISSNLISSVKEDENISVGIALLFLLSMLTGCISFICVVVFGIVGLIKDVKYVNETRQQEIINAKTIVNCPFCQGENQIDAKFCSYCGKSLEGMENSSPLYSFEDKKTAPFKYQAKLWTMTLKPLIVLAVVFFVMFAGLLTGYFFSDINGYHSSILLGLSIAVAFVCFFFIVVISFVYIGIPSKSKLFISNKIEFYESSIILCTEDRINNKVLETKKKIYNFSFHDLFKMKIKNGYIYMIFLKGQSTLVGYCFENNDSEFIKYLQENYKKEKESRKVTKKK